MKAKVFIIIIALAGVLLCSVASPLLGFGKYLDSSMRNWSIEDSIDYFDDPNGMSFFIMYYDEAIWNVC